jgi:hypothetical protein
MESNSNPKWSRRTRDQLSKSAKPFGGIDMVNHLVNPEVHDLHAVAQKEWMLENKLERAGMTLPDDYDKKSLGNMANKVGFEESSDDDVAEVTPESIEHITTTGIVLSVVRIGKPGKRSWQHIEGKECVAFLIAEQESRSNYINSSRHHIANSNNALHVIISRLPPWTALEVGESLAKDNNKLSQKTVDLSDWFSERYNVDVIAAVVHRESDHDLHVHMVFSRTREVAVSRSPSARQISSRKKALNREAREMLKAAGKPATNREVARLVQQWIAEKRKPDPTAEYRLVENRRYDDKGETIRRNVMGHAFRSKLQIWRVSKSEDKDAVAALWDKPAEDRYSFRGRIIAAEKSGQKLEDFWWDLAISEKWNALCQQDLDQASLERIGQQGAKMAHTYLLEGSTVPDPIDLLTASQKRMETEIKDLRAEKQITSRQLDRLQKEYGQMRIEIDRHKSQENKIRAEFQLPSDTPILDGVKKFREQLMCERDTLKSEIDAVRSNFGLSPEVSLFKGIMDILRQIAACILKATAKVPILRQDICKDLERTPLAEYLLSQTPCRPPARREKDQSRDME